MFARLDRWISRMEDKLLFSGSNYDPQYIIASIIGSADKDSPLPVVITGTLSKELLEQAAEQLRKTADQMGVRGIAFAVAVAVTEIDIDNQGVLLVEQKRKSVIKAVEKEIDFLNNLGIKIFGMVLV